MSSTTNNLIAIGVQIAAVSGALVAIAVAVKLLSRLLHSGGYYYAGDDYYMHEQEASWYQEPTWQAALVGYGSYDQDQWIEAYFGVTGRQLVEEGTVV